MPTTAQAILDEANYVQSVADRYQSDVDYFNMVYPVLMAEVPESPEDVKTFKRQARLLVRMKKKNERLVKRCLKAKARLMRVHDKAVRRSHDRQARG